MTRINLVPPSELVDKHLLAEYRELPRIYGLAHRYFLKGEPGEPGELPKLYVLGKGHMKFFIYKLLFLHKRHNLIIEEMKRRGFKPNFTGSLPESVRELPARFFGDYSPTSEAVAINRQRIFERIPKSHVASKRAKEAHNS